MKRKNSSIKLALLPCTFALVAISPVAAQTADQPTEKTIGNYVVTQSVELGVRDTDKSGSSGMYDTFVNLQTGPRLFEQTFSLIAPEHDGALFDDLYISSFGWGGDPNNVARARASKAKLYDFTALFRRDQNYFDYNLLSNPLNPLSLVPAADQAPNSPHAFYNVRRMTDLALTLLPQSAISVRLGYSHLRTDGPSFSSNESSNTPLLFQEISTFTNNYQIGVDFKVLPKTTISYDQFLQWYRGDTSDSLSQTPFLTSNGLPVDIGNAWGPDGATAACFNAAGQVIVAPGCYVYQAYNRFNPYKTHTPTEQLSLQSQAIKHVDLSGRFNYSASTLQSPYFDLFQGFTRGNVVEQIENGTAGTGKRISDTADFGVTIHITDRTRFLYSFRFLNWRMPSSLDFATLTWTGTGALPTPPSSTGTPPSSTSSVAYSNFLGNNMQFHQFELEQDFTRAFGGRIGFRYKTSAIREQGLQLDLLTGAVSGIVGQPTPTANTIDIHEDTGIVGLWYRPSQKLRASADAEFGTADNFQYRIEPRRQLQYRARVNYKPERWAILSASGNFLEQRNGVSEIAFNGHNRNAGFSSTFLPSDKFNFELAYNYNNYQSNSFVCFQDSTVPLPPGSFPSTGICALGNPLLVPFLGGSPLNAETYGVFANRVHFVDAAVIWTPVRQVSANLGYGIVSSNGQTSPFDPIAPSGSLRNNYHRPLPEFKSRWPRIEALPSA